MAGKFAFERSFALILPILLKSILIIYNRNLTIVIEDCSIEVKLLL